MQTIEAIVLVVSFFTILGIPIAVHARMKKEFKVEASWVGVAIVPMLIWLVTAGQLSEFSGFGLTLKLQGATTVPLSRLASEGTFETKPVSVDGKGAPHKIDEYIKQRLEALSFELRRTEYYIPGAVREYLNRLSEHKFFQYVVFVEGDGSFAGLIPANTLLKELREKEERGLVGDRWDYFVRLIEENALEELRGVVTASAVKESSKAEALRAMAEKNVTQLPVVDRNGQFVGVINQEKLANSILIEFLSQL